MGNYTREEILQMVEEEDVEFIRLQFTDMFGAIKNIAVTARELPRALNNQCVIDGEQIAGTSGLKDADLYLRPVLGYICDPAVATTTGKSSTNDL